MSCLEAALIIWATYVLPTATNGLEETRPDRNILIVSRVHSGSSFLAELIQSWNNSTFYDFEPLIKIDHDSDVRKNKKEDKSIKILNEIWNCDYGSSKQWIDRLFGKNGNFLSRNPIVYNAVNKKFPDAKRQNKNVIKLFNDLCKESPIHLMKVLRLRMVQVGKMMEEMDPESRKTLKIIFLYRDPRGVYNSRKLRDQCSDSCKDIKGICLDMKSNILEYLELKRRYPDQVYIVRFEDVSSNPMKFVEGFFPRALNFSLNRDVEQYILSHTKKNERQKGRQFSTIRNSKKTTFKWAHQLSHKRIKQIDSICQDALNLGGYKLYEEVQRKAWGDLSNISWLKNIPEFLNNF